MFATVLFAPGGARVEFAEHLLELVVGEQRLEHSLKDDVDEALVEAAVLEHVEDAEHAEPQRLAPQERLQVLCNKNAHALTRAGAA